MTANVVYFALIISYFNVNFIDCATFENVEVVLTERQEIPPNTDIDIRDPTWIPPKKTILILSDDNLGKYVKNETELKVIDILNQTLPKLTTNSISDLPITTELRINWCSLKEIEPGTFQNLPKLQNIDLNYNELETIKNGVFAGLDITVLTMEGNQITTIEDKAFNNMKLQYIHLYHNRLSSWNSDWFNGSPLRSIFVGFNQIEELPEKSFNFVVKTAKTPEPVGDRTKIFPNRNQPSVYVDFSFNKIKKIASGAFNNWDWIEDINLKNNELEIIQNGAFSGLKYLGGLHLDNNKITKIDEEMFEKDVRIISLGLEDNQLSTFPLVLLKKNVEYLRVNNNPIQCDWVKSVEEWMSNKTGDYLHPNFSPAVWNIDEIKEKCVK